MTASTDVIVKGRQCRLRLGFRPLIRFGTLIGFCSGVLAIPLYALGIFLGSDNFGDDVPKLVIVVLIAPPLMGALNFALFSVLAYPLYSLFKLRTYSGEFEIISITDNHTN